MVSKCKRTLVSLSAAFVTAAILPLAFVAESGYGAYKAGKQARLVTDDLLARSPVEPDAAVTGVIEGYNTCLNEFAHPAQGKGQALYRWSDRLSFLPGLAGKLQAAGDRETAEGVQAAAGCLLGAVRKIMSPAPQPRSSIIREVPFKKGVLKHAT